MATKRDPGVTLAELDPYSAADMLRLARVSLEEWAHSRARTAAEGRAARGLAFAFRRLDSMGVFDRIDTPP